MKSVSMGEGIKENGGGGESTMIIVRTFVNVTVYLTYNSMIIKNGDKKSK
jgi:hypothetical protein